MEKLQQKIGYHFKNRRLLKDALTLAHGNKAATYERLEFLGDRVLGLIVADMLLIHHKNEKEGDIAKRFTALVREETLADLAKQYNVHVALVAHPRKTVSFLRLIDIAGSANIGNLIDSAFIVHRVNHDFKKGYMDEFCRPGTKEEDVTLFNGTNVIEIAKDREEGIQDEFIPLWYEIESRRIKNSQTEVIKYNWTTEWIEEERTEEFMDSDCEEIPWE